MSRLLSLALLAGIPTVALVGCSTAPDTAADKQDLKSEAQSALSRAQARDSSLEPLLASSAGYAVFPDAGKGGLIVGGGYGKGVLYENGMPTGYCDLTQASVGAEVGGQQFSEIIIFQTTEALQSFKGGDFSFGADASAIAVDQGAASRSIFKNGIAVFQWSEKGLQAQASLTGQQFRYQPIMNGSSSEMEAQPAGGKMEPQDNTPSNPQQEAPDRMPYDEDQQ